jgi:hypothetical protein
MSAHMSEHVSVEIVDPDAAAGSDDGVVLSRADFLTRAVVAGGALTAGGVSLRGLPGLAAVQASAAMDIEILNYFLMIEHLQEAFYDRAVAEGSLSGELQEFATTVRVHEREHISFLEQVLGADARSAPRFDFGSSTSSPENFQRAAVIVEETSASAYIGQGANLTKANVLSAARIVSVEARHAAWIRDILGRLPAPKPADVAKSEAQVMRTLRNEGWLP